MPRGNFLSTNQKHYQDLGSARHRYGISALVTQTSFCEDSCGDLAKRRLFSQATISWIPFRFVCLQIDRPLSDDRVDTADLIDEPFVNYQERMTRAMKELTRKAHDMVI